MADLSKNSPKQTPVATKSLPPVQESTSWTWIGDTTRGDEFNGDDNGKYLFFDSDRQKLIELAQAEISTGEYVLAKVAREARDNEYVLCLYWYDDSRKHQLADKYRDVVKYRYWKDNATTRSDMLVKVMEADWDAPGVFGSQD